MSLKKVIEKHRLVKSSKKLRETLAFNLKFLRGENTLEDIYSKAKLSKMTYCLLEAGHTNPTLSTLEALAKIHNVAAADLIDDQLSGKSK